MQYVALAVLLNKYKKRKRKHKKLGEGEIWWKPRPPLFSISSPTTPLHLISPSTSLLNPKPETPNPFDIEQRKGERNTGRCQAANDATPRSVRGWAMFLPGKRQGWWDQAKPTAPPVASEPTVVGLHAGELRDGRRCDRGRGGGRAVATSPHSKP